ncbi:hypothetical protein OPKNFCMD_6151 [Methylobacterium crusticola]|uniref:ABC transporter substrate-binding protein n=1 Tax=Methylobacterium crusticola TaxID=1697972 RepID=A0ABQ4R9B8_9HYPH|nr:ABC transporter substrate-binding protein [Methylobacterium crusticola]GJD53376.1 hypothetical protein OPKNFCMD_6151 [Methylobacterium crusticola]
MTRRDWIALLGSALIARPFPAPAQGGPSPDRVGVITAYDEADPETQARLGVFKTALFGLSGAYRTGLSFVHRWTSGDLDRMRTSARELVDLRPRVILAATTPVVAALLRETASIPIVFVSVSDPLGSGFVRSLAQPGGNVTGFMNTEGSLGGRWVQILKEITPAMLRAVMMYNPKTAPYAKFYIGPFESAAIALNVTPVLATVHDEREIEEVVAGIGRGGGGLILMNDSFNTIHRKFINTITLAYKVPTISYSRIITAEGGLVSYGVDEPETYARAALYVDRILRGARAGDLPVQIPAKFKFVINLRTARTLGIEIPDALLARADEDID